MVLAVTAVLTARRRDALALRGILGPPVGAVVAALGFSVFVPDGALSPGGMLGRQLMAAPVSAAAIVIVLGGVLWVGRRETAAAG